MYELTFKIDWLEQAKALTQYVAEHFSDKQETLFYYTPDWQNDIVVRKKEYFDNATPSGNSMMAENLFKLGLYFDNADWRQLAFDMNSKIQNIAQQYSASFGNWLVGLTTHEFGFNEIVITGKNLMSESKEILKEFLPINIIASSETKEKRLPIFNDKNFSDKTYFYLCRNFSCEQPVFSTQELLNSINSFAH